MLLVLIKKKTQLIDTVYIIIFVRTFDLIPSKDIALLHLLGESHGCNFSVHLGANPFFAVSVRCDCQFYFVTPALSVLKYYLEIFWGF